MRLGFSSLNAFKSTRSKEKANSPAGPSASQSSDQDEPQAYQTSSECYTTIHPLSGQRVYGTFPVRHPVPDEASSSSVSPLFRRGYRKV